MIETPEVPQIPPPEGAMTTITYEDIVKHIDQRFKELSDDLLTKFVTADDAQKMIDNAVKPRPTRDEIQDLLSASQKAIQEQMTAFVSRMEHVANGMQTVFAKTMETFVLKEVEQDGRMKVIEEGIHVVKDAASKTEALAAKVDVFTSVFNTVNAGINSAREEVRQAVTRMDTLEDRQDKREVALRVRFDKLEDQQARFDVENADIRRGLAILEISNVGVAKALADVQKSLDQITHDIALPRLVGMAGLSALKSPIFIRVIGSVIGGGVLGVFVKFLEFLAQ
jgi:hypothetical protein